MYHSVIFGGKNTFDDWKIVPSERPVFVPPTQKTNFIDIPGADGSLDVSDSLTGYPVFNDREGSLNFTVLNEYEHYNWAVLYSDIMTHLHGRKMHAILEDDPNWYYDGRFWVDAWTPDSYHSKITIKYRVNPYKWSVRTSTDPNWLWDPFNFEEDSVVPSPFVNITVTSNDFWTIMYFDETEAGNAPVCPIFRISTNSGNGMRVYIRNTTLGTYAERSIPEGTSSHRDLMIFGGDNEIGFKGAGTVSLEFRRGRL